MDLQMHHIYSCFLEQSRVILDSSAAGVVKSKRSIWRLRTISDFFKAIVNFIVVFFVTMFSVCFLGVILFSKFPHSLSALNDHPNLTSFLQLDKTNKYKKLGSSKKWDGGAGGGGPGGGGGPYGGGGGPRGPRTLSDLRSNDHSKISTSNLLNFVGFSPVKISNWYLN